MSSSAPGSGTPTHLAGARTTMNIALVCDWLTGMRGGERCLEALCELYPCADIFTLVHLPGSVSPTIERHKISVSYIGSLPGDVRRFRRYLPLFPHAIERFDLSLYELVVSLSHCVAKGAKPPPGAPHICYCHTPMRYAWHMRQLYLQRFGAIGRWIAGRMLDHLQRWDKTTADRVDHFIANSENVRRRIRDCYGRDSTVIYPPVDCARFSLSQQDDGYYLIVSALVPYKRVDLAVEAFRRLDRPLRIVGDGPQMARLKKMAPKHVQFAGSVGDGEVAQQMRNCSALVFPGEEDFGIVPLEAQACGKAVIAFAAGGALETVIGLDDPAAEAAPTGVFFKAQSAEALRQAVLAFEKRRHDIRAQACRDNALRFDRPRFKRAMHEYINAVAQERMSHVNCSRARR